MRTKALAATAIATLAFVLSVPATAKTVTLEVVTAIEEPDCQYGTKSAQKVVIDTATLEVDSSHITGTTKILGCEFSSINDHFVMEGLVQDGNGFRFNVVGRTATVASLGLGGGD